eukprot:scaffold36824_cov255-Skeletonema_dohrnii-CCMP3373.AAC.1
MKFPPGRTRAASTQHPSDHPFACRMEFSAACCVLEGCAPDAINFGAMAEEDDEGGDDNNNNIIMMLPPNGRDYVSIHL